MHQKSNTTNVRTGEKTEAKNATNTKKNMENKTKQIINRMIYRIYIDESTPS